MFQIFLRIKEILFLRELLLLVLGQFGLLPGAARIFAGDRHIVHGILIHKGHGSLECFYYIFRNKSLKGIIQNLFYRLFRQYLHTIMKRIKFENKISTLTDDLLVVLTGWLELCDCCAGDLKRAEKLVGARIFEGDGNFFDTFSGTISDTWNFIFKDFSDSNFF